MGSSPVAQGVRTEDAYGNPAGGFDGRVLVILHSRHVRFSQGHGKVPTIVLRFIIAASSHIVLDQRFCAALDFALLSLARSRHRGWEVFVVCLPVV